MFSMSFVYAMSGKIKVVIVLGSSDGHRQVRGNRSLVGHRKHEVVVVRLAEPSKQPTDAIKF